MVVALEAIDFFGDGGGDPVLWAAAAKRSSGGLAWCLAGGRRCKTLCGGG